jgi:trk system potassium uptake protein TrkA
MATFVIIVGGGKVGTHLAAVLLEAGFRIRVIEEHRSELARLQRDLPAEVVTIGDGTDPLVLEAAGIRQAHVVAAVTGLDEVNLVITSLARFEFGVPRVIARVANPKNAWMFTPEMGVDVALNQADMMAHLIAEEMSLGDMVTLLNLRKGQYSLVAEKVVPGSVVAGKALRDIDLPDACRIVAIIRQGELVVPHGDTVLQPVDEVLALVRAAQAAKLAAVLGANAEVP